MVIISTNGDVGGVGPFGFGKGVDFPGLDEGVKGGLGNGEWVSGHD